MSRTLCLVKEKLLQSYSSSCTQSNYPSDKLMLIIYKASPLKVLLILNEIIPIFSNQNCCLLTLVILIQ